MYKLKILLFTKYLIFQIIKINRVIILGVEKLHKCFIIDICVFLGVHYFLLTIFF